MYGEGRRRKIVSFREEMCLAFSTDRLIKSPVQIPKERRHREKNKAEKLMKN